MNLPSERCELEAACQHFDLSQVLAVLDRDVDGNTNAAWLCCDRHADDPGRVAMRHRACDGKVSDWTFSQLRMQSTRCAEAMAALGVGKGDRVACLLPRSPELLIVILATWRLGAVYQPLFTAFGSKAIDYRIAEAGTRLIVTDAGNIAKIDAHAGNAGVLVVGAAPGSGHRDFWTEVAKQPGKLQPVPCSIDDPFLIMFTSGTTGAAKPLLVPLKAIAAFANYVRDAVDLRSGDVFWNLADPGWAYGLYYGVTAPLALGYATTFNERGFEVDDVYDVIERLDITILAGSPTAYRLIMAGGAEKAERVNGRLRAVSSAGEPLNPEIIRWFEEHLGVTIHDHYGQTELGAVQSPRASPPSSAWLGGVRFSGTSRRGGLARW